MKSILALALATLLSLAACDNVDRSKPAEVLNAWLQHNQAKEYGEAYDLLSIASKRLQSKDDYVKAEIAGDTLDYTIHKFSDITEATTYQKVPGAKRMMAKVKWSTKDDSGDRMYYYTLIWDKHEWSVANAGPQERDAEKATERGDLKAGRRLLQDAIKVAPYDIDLYVGISYFFYQEGRYSDMKQWLDKGLSIDDEKSDLHNLYALYLERRGEWSLALKKLDIAANLAENDNVRSTIFTNTSLMCIMNGDYDRAAIYLMKAKKLNKDMGEIARVEGELCKAKRDFSNAATAFGEAMASEENFTQKKWIARSYIEVLSALHERQKAKDVLLELLVEKPDDDELLGLYQQFK